MIEIRSALVFQQPELRIREYCDIEIYHEYDGRHNVNNVISRNDIVAANSLYASIDRYDKTESRRLLRKSRLFSKTLSRIPNTPLHVLAENQWSEIRTHVEILLEQFLDVHGIGLAKATKILHLKRPELFPVLDSYVIAFLLADTLGTNKSRDVKTGIRALELARKTIWSNLREFKTLQKKTCNLPIALTIVRLFDILCWTTTKWDLRGITTAKYGEAKRSLMRLL